MLQNHPRRADPALPLYSIAQEHLEEELGVDLPVSLEIRGPVPPDLFIAIV
jgi:hypothetical protein